jgi:hypothetical protein
MQQIVIFLKRAKRQPLLTRLRATTLVALAAGGLAAGCSGNVPEGPNAPSPGATAAESHTPTADAAVRSSPVVPGRRARVFIFAGFGDNCEDVPPPQITVTAPPSKGEVTFVPGQETTIKTSAKGTCIGQTAKGTGVYYTARAGTSGADRFTVTARLASGETTTRTFEVHIAE